MKDEYIEQILAIEWDMFQKTQNIGGRAWCQNDHLQFDANRMAQFINWDEQTLALYLKDLKEAEGRGENLVTLKYAYMMESTSPAEFQQLKGRLPAVSAEKQQLAERMAEMTARWCEEFAARNPALARRGRPARTEADRPGVTSAQTYSRGELFTYSLETLKSLLAVYEQYEKEQVNFFEKTVDNEIRLIQEFAQKGEET